MKQVGILGLPGSGKTTVFEILTQGAGSVWKVGAALLERIKGDMTDAPG